MTVEIDVTAFGAASRIAQHRTYIAQIRAISSVVNRHDEFRMVVDEDGRPAVWREVSPSFTVFVPERETFACLCVPFDTDFAAFHRAAERTMAAHRGTTEFFPQGVPPGNSFDVSSVPWTDFTGFQLAIKNAWTHPAPIFTLGRYVERGDQTTLPLSVQIHHAAADGFHTGRLVNELREMFVDVSWVTRA